MSSQKVILTPVSKSATRAVMRVERRRLQTGVDDVLHEAGGQHQGLVVNNRKMEEDDDTSFPHDVALEFRVFMADAAEPSRQKNEILVQEKRSLRFRFQDESPVGLDKTRNAYDFFIELVNPESFPKDYISFIKKIMKQAQKYPHISCIEIEMNQVEGEVPDSLKDNSLAKIISVGNAWNYLESQALPAKRVTEERLLELLESAYPNNVSIKDIERLLTSEGTKTSGTEIETYLDKMAAGGLIECMPNGSWMRAHKREQAKAQKHEVRMVKSLPVVTPESQPTIAIITVNFVEKTCVDAMMENKVTFVKYKAEGESHVYTIGNIGGHHVISTKLPAVGKSRTEMIAAGNTTTRLLGSFQNVEHVLLVGVCGGVPHYTDYTQHPRLGDVIVSTPVTDRKYVYAYCEDCTKDLDQKTTTYTIRTWSPSDFVLQNIVRRLGRESGRSESSWRRYAREGRETLTSGNDAFVRPAPEADKLYMGIGGGAVIQVKHPEPPADTPPSPSPAVRFGAIGSGRVVAEEDAVRQDFANRYGIIAMDMEFDTVLESIYGSRINSFLFVRGVADYADGTRAKEWKNYAALNAAAFMKAVVEKIPGAG